MNSFAENLLWLSIYLLVSIAQSEYCFSFFMTWHAQIYKLSFPSNKLIRDVISYWIWLKFNNIVLWAPRITMSTAMKCCPRGYGHSRVYILRVRVGYWMLIGFKILRDLPLNLLGTFRHRMAIFNSSFSCLSLSLHQRLFAGLACLMPVQGNRLAWVKMS